MYENFSIQVTNTTAKNLELKQFVLKHHYLKSISRGNKRCFGLFINGTLKGVALFGHPVGTNVIKNYGPNTLELKRFCLSPDLKKNTASWFIAKTIKDLRIQKIQTIISYADPSQGHEGIIYKASNFQYIGRQKYSSVYFKINNKKIHSRNFYCKNTSKYDIYKGKGLKRMYSKPKHIFVYKIK